jgi:hypothetical protein
MMFVPTATVAHYLGELHYLGDTHRGIAWSDDFGVIVLAPPTSRRLPCDWLEISRWCIESTEPNAGSRQYAALRRELDTTTVVSYSDPGVGHTGALYRACGFLWAPTWLRLREPPSGNGRWTEGERQSVKDRWVDPIRPDERRPDVLAVKDAAIIRRMPWADWREPDSRRGRLRRGTGGADYARFAQQQAAVA